jgi:hypothetical protein
MTALLQPDGDQWQVCVSTHAGINPIGARLYKITEKQRQQHRVELPSLETRNLSREEADLRLKEWTLFLTLQDKIKK